MIAAEAVDKLLSAGPEATEEELVLLGIMFDQAAAVCFLQATVCLCTGRRASRSRTAQVSCIDTIMKSATL